MDTQPVTFRIPAALHRRLRREAFDREVSMNAITVRAIEAILDDDDVLADLEADKKAADGDGGSAELMRRPLPPRLRMRPSGTCSGCGEARSLRPDGRIRFHSSGASSECSGSGLPAAVPDSSAPAAGT